MAACYDPRVGPSLSPWAAVRSMAPMPESVRARVGCLLLLAGACAAGREGSGFPGELPVLGRRGEIAHVATAGPARCALLRDDAALSAFLHELSIRVADVPIRCERGFDVLAVLTEDLDGTDVWLATEEGVDVVTLVLPATSGPGGTSRLHLLALARRSNQLAVVLREASHRGERTLAVFAR